jgi:hypothetical protein
MLSCKRRHAQHPRTPKDNRTPLVLLSVTNIRTQQQLYESPATQPHHCGVFSAFASFAEVVAPLSSVQSCQLQVQLRCRAESSSQDPTKQPAITNSDSEQTQHEHTMLSSMRSSTYTDKQPARAAVDAARHKHSL